MAIKPPKDRGIKERLIRFPVKFALLIILVTSLILFFVGEGIAGLLLFAFSNAITLVFKWWYSRKMGIYEYNKKEMSEAEASARASLGEHGDEIDNIKGVIRNINGWKEEFRKIKNDPEYARQRGRDMNNLIAQKEATLEAIVPFYKTNKKINSVISVPFLLWSVMWIKLFEVIRRKIRKK